MEDISFTVRSRSAAQSVERSPLMQGLIFQSRQTQFVTASKPNSPKKGASAGKGGRLTGSPIRPYKRCPLSQYLKHGYEPLLLHGYIGQHLKPFTGNGDVSTFMSENF